MYNKNTTPVKREMSIHLPQDLRKLVLSFIDNFKCNICSFGHCFDINNQYDFIEIQQYDKQSICMRCQHIKWNEESDPYNFTILNIEDL